MSSGYFTLVLHSHLPWVLHHGRWPHGVDWLNEATAETYLPLWRAFHSLADREQGLGVALGLSPVLCEQLAHPDFHSEFVHYLDHKIGAAREDRATFSRLGDAPMAALAEGWEAFYRATLEDFMGPHGPNLVARFRRLQEAGAIEILTCAATHGYLPLLSSDRAAERQVRVACAAHRRHFGRAPAGIWLPECAYRPAGPWPSAAMAEAGGLDRPRIERSGIEEILARHELRYFFVDTHLLSGGKPLGVYADRFEALRHLAREPERQAPAPDRPHYRPHRVGEAGALHCFARDPVTAIQVWSGEHGYPGDGEYLDFHKKHFPGGHRYWRVTHPQADLGDKQVYRPPLARARAPVHAAHFLSLVTRTLDDAAPFAPEAPVACAMFDTELFGHWWFEGPAFLAEMLRGATAGPQPITPSAYLERHPARDRVALPEGSWGDGGGHKVWLNDDTRAAWDAVHRAESRFESLLHHLATHPADPLLERLTRQAGRELLLLEASDWPFLITTQSARDYAEQRLAEHAADFTRLADLVDRRAAGGALAESDAAFVAECERRDGLFPDFDWRGLTTPEFAVTG